MTELDELIKKQKELEERLLSPESLSRLGQILSQELTSLLGTINDCSSGTFDNLDETTHNIDTALETAEYICHLLRILEVKADIQKKSPEKVG
jgi:hypothetical protein